MLRTFSNLQVYVLYHYSFQRGLNTIFEAKTRETPIYSIQLPRSINNCIFSFYSFHGAIVTKTIYFLFSTNIINYTSKLNLEQCFKNNCISYAVWLIVLHYSYVYCVSNIIGKQENTVTHHNIYLYMLCLRDESERPRNSSSTFEYFKRISLNYLIIFANGKKNYIFFSSYF